MASMTAKNKKASEGERAIKRWTVTLTVGVVIASVCVFEAVDYYFNVVMRHWDAVYDPIIGIGMIVPMGLIVGLISFGAMTATSRYASRLVAGISRIADGDFDVRLDERKGGPFKDVFQNFNKMGEELRGVQTLREDFINQFSHEFKTPIMSINGFASLLLEEKVSEEERKDYLRIIASESERLAELSSSTLLLAKLESQQYVVDKEPYSLDEQLRQCVILLAPRWTKKQLELSADLAPVTYNGNADLMKQVWINLLSNAIKFTPEHGEVSIGLKEAEGRILVTVSDTGKGMTGEELSRAFEKYYQGDRAASKGLGLGLSIVKKIVDLCGGRIEVRSALGEGSSFAVSLPFPAAPK